MLIDITTLTSAEEYIRSQNRHAQPFDPFARQCFVELTQSLIFMESAYVAHPVIPDPKIEDFGGHPRMLRRLVESNGLRLLRMNSSEWAEAQGAEREILTLLKTSGTRTLIQFIDQALVCDQADAKSSLSHRIQQWSAFQEGNVHVPGSHGTRIPTSDGVEDDDFGEWARSASSAIEGLLTPFAANKQSRTNLVAVFVRGLRYAARGEVMGNLYQSHPIRRDFFLTFEMQRLGVESSLVLDVIKLVRGIHETIGGAWGKPSSHRMHLMELELPLLGGRLWKSEESGKRSDDAWVDLVIERIMRYREEAAPLRRAIRDCTTDEDAARLMVELEQAGTAVLERLGLRRVEISSVERDLMDGVASVAQAVTGIPKVSGLLIGSQSIVHKMAGRRRRAPYQQFLYKEFLRAYRASG